MAHAYRPKRKRAPTLSYRNYDKAYGVPVLGIDEVGTGAIAGPVYAAGVVLPPEPDVLDMLEKLHLRDSKQMSPGSRERVFDFLTNIPSFRYWVVRKSPQEITDMGQHEALASLIDEIIAWKFQELGQRGVTLIDGHENKSVTFKDVRWITKGDTRSLAIAAASVMAKVTRDLYMTNQARVFPDYGFQSHFGYLTPEHMAALNNHGPCGIHRMNTSPVKKRQAGKMLEERIKKAKEAPRIQLLSFGKMFGPSGLSPAKPR